MNITLLDRLTRLVCKPKLLPLKVRSAIARSLRGNESSCGDRQFAVPFFGSRFYGGLGSHIDWHVFFFGCYDPLGLALLRQIASRLKDPVALDIGANVGNHALMLAKYCRQVHCFEPYPKVLPQLKQNVHQNQLSHVAIHEFGLSDAAGQAEYYENAEHNFGAGSFESTHNNVQGESSMSLELRRAEDAFPDLGITRFEIVKLDVEGHEVSVLRGMGRALRDARPFVFMENGPTTHQHFSSPDEFLKLFPDDYLFYRLTHANRWSRSTPRLAEFDYEQNCNMLAVPAEKQWICKPMTVAR
ncbi:MAG: FkbM family methyltransferase [Pirellulales bacterium]|nr:FkbM family methyltransferase [Pirellulales bacterium]